MMSFSYDIVHEFIYKKEADVPERIGFSSKIWH